MHTITHTNVSTAAPLLQGMAALDSAMEHFQAERITHGLAKLIDALKASREQESEEWPATRFAFCCTRIHSRNASLPSRAAMRGTPS